MFLVEAAEPAGSCAPDGETMCLRDSRYQVRATWIDPDGETLNAGVVHAGTNDSGLLWFPDREKWEVLVKVLDGCSINGADWVFLASATDLGFEVTVTDTATGNEREYRNEPGMPSPAVADTGAFPGVCEKREAPAARSGSTAADPTPTSLAAVEGASTSGGGTPAALFLHDGRFEVAVEWSTADGRRGEARPARPATVESGLLWFFGPDNWEMLVKVLDGCWFNDHYWVYAASATDVGLDISVTDTKTGDVRRYTKSPGAPAPALADAAAFRNSCPSD